MRKIAFTKMQGIGNDYVYIDCTKEEVLREEEISAFSIKVSDRHFGTYTLEYLRYDAGNHSGCSHSYIFTLLFL